MSTVPRFIPKVSSQDLSGELGTVAKSEASSEMGLRLKSESGKVWYTLEGDACLDEAAIESSLVAQIGPSGKSTTHELAFDTTTGKQSIKEIKLDSGELEKPKFGFGASEMTVSDPAKLTFEEAVEI